jgi:hypothetical protein
MFERLDKDRFVRAYIQSQQLHTTTYAADGKAYVFSWDHQISETPAKQRHPTHSSEHYGFDTPVLRARVAKPHDAYVVVAEHPTDLDLDKRESEPAKKVQFKKPFPLSTKPNKKECPSKNDKENVPPESESRNTKPASKKRPIPAGSDDDDHVARESRFFQRFQGAGIMSLLHLRAY